MHDSQVADRVADVHVIRTEAPLLGGQGARKQLFRLVQTSLAAVDHG